MKFNLYILQLFLFTRIVVEEVYHYFNTYVACKIIFTPIYIHVWSCDLIYLLFRVENFSHVRVTVLSGLYFS